MTTDEKLKHFLEASIESATSQSTQLIDDYSKALDIIFEDHKTDTLRKAELQIRLGKESLEREMNKELFREQLLIKRETTRRQAALKSMLFSEIEELLAEYMTTPGYRELLVRRIKEASSFAGKEEITIYIDPSDAPMQKDLEAATHARLTVSETGFMGGIRAVIRSRNILIDDSFETRLKEAKDAYTFIIK